MKTKASRKVVREQSAQRSLFSQVWTFVTQNLALFSVLLSILIVFSPVLGKHFEQDEWFDTGSNQIYTAARIPFFIAVFRILFSLQPVTQLFNFLSYSFFGVQNWPFSVAVIVLVLMNAVVWYRFVRTVTGSVLIALGSLVFAVFNFAAHQAITWSQPAVAYQLAFLGIVLSLHAFFDFLNSSKRSELVKSLLFLGFAMLTRYNSFFMMALLPLTAMIFHWQEFPSRIKRVFLLGIAAFVALATFFIVIPPSYQPIGQERFIHSRSQIILNIVILPAKSFSQLLLNRYSYLDELARSVMARYYLNVAPSTREMGVITELLAILITLLCAVVFLMTTSLSESRRKQTLFFVAFFGLCFSPYIFDKFSTATAMLESRYFFLPVFSAGVLIMIWFENIWQRLLSDAKWKATGFVLLCSLVALVYLAHNIYSIFTWEILSAQMTQKRVEVLDFARKQFVENTSGDVILFIRDVGTTPASAKNVTGSLYQTGFMYPFLVYSYPSGRIPYQVFEDRTFWNMEFQGVKEVNGRKFGLFYDYAALQAYVLAQKIPAESLYALELDYSASDSRKTKIFPIFAFSDVKYRDVSQSLRESLDYAPAAKN